MEIMTEKDENSQTFKYCHVEDMFTEIKNYFLGATIVQILIAFFICISIDSLNLGNLWKRQYFLLLVVFN
jgi:hypothetical protein